jgi:heme oxygenase
MTLIEKLRKETKPYHDRLDQHIVLSKLTSTKVSLEDYKKYLKLFHGIHAILEIEISNTIEAKLPFEKRLPFIEKEMGALSIEKNDLTIDMIEFSKWSALGGYYVLEGSRLGGTFIAQHLSKNLALNNHEFSFLKQKPSYSWKSVLSAIDSVEEQHHGEIVKGAKLTFQFILSYVNEFYGLRKA